MEASAVAVVVVKRAPVRKVAPCVVMREMLVCAKRDGETSFDRAWRAAWDRMDREKVWPHATVERHQWKDVLVATRPEYRKAWAGVPSAFQRVSLAILTTMHDADELREEAGVVLAVALG